MITATQVKKIININSGESGKTRALIAKIPNKIIPIMIKWLVAKRNLFII